MPRNSRLFEKTTIYHSEAVKAGPFAATVTSEEHESKFSKPSDPKYVVGLKIDGEDHLYQTENEECGKAFKGWKGQTVTIEAKGHKEDAEIIITDDAGDRRHSPPPDRGTSRGGGQERGRDNERGGRSQERGSNRSGGQEPEEDRATIEAKALKKTRAMAARCSVLGAVAFKAAEFTLIEHFGPTAFENSVKVEDIRALAALMFIELARGTDISKLPLQMPEPEAPKQREEPRQPERQEPKKDPDEDAELDDIPF